MIGGDDGAFLFGLGKVQAHVSDGAFKVGHRSGNGFKGSFVEYEAGPGFHHVSYTPLKLPTIDAGSTSVVDGQIKKNDSTTTQQEMNANQSRSPK